MTKFKDENDYSGYGIAADDRKATVISFSDRDATDIVVPPVYQGVPVKRIGFGAFRGNENLRTIVLPDSVEIIDSNAFRACKSLEKAVLSKQLRIIQSNAFSDCPNLRSITISSKLQTLSNQLFLNDRKLTEMNIWDMNRDDGSCKRFVVAAINESRRYGTMNASLLYFDTYSMKKYDESYNVIQEFEDLFNMAEFRLFNDDQLTDHMRSVYENMFRISIPRLIEEDQVERLTSVGTYGSIITQDTIDDLLEMASEKKGRCLAYLLDLKHEQFEGHDLRFEL